MARLSFTTSRALGKSALRRANERLLLDSIRRRPGISRAAIAALTGFSRTSVTFVVNRLIRQGLVEEIKAGIKARGKAASRTGRPPSELRLVGSALMAVGVEISRPQCRVILVDLNGARLYEGTAPWTADSDALFVQIQAIIRAIAGGRRSRRVIGVGVSLPGTLDKATGRIVAAESLGWFGVEAGRRLSAGLPWQFWFENDSNLSALAEQWFGDPQAKALRYFVSVRPQGGLGTGVIVDYLVSRPDIDRTRVGATGRSGGGMTTFFLAAIDPRIRASAPVSGTLSTAGWVRDRLGNLHCDCQFPVNLYGLLYSEIGALTAPRAQLHCNANADAGF